MTELRVWDSKKQNYITHARVTEEEASVLKLVGFPMFYTIFPSYYVWEPSVKGGGAALDKTGKEALEFLKAYREKRDG